MRYKMVSPRVMLIAGKPRLLKPGYLPNGTATTWWHRNAAWDHIAPYVVKSSYPTPYFAYVDTMKPAGKRYRGVTWPVDPRRELTGVADVGGYTVLYVTADGCELCAKCATEQATHRGLDWPRIVDVAGYPEGPTLQCANCNIDMVSDYGDPDENEG